MAYPDPKGERDSSMPANRRSRPGVRGEASWDRGNGCLSGGRIFASSKRICSRMNSEAVGDGDPTPRAPLDAEPEKVEAVVDVGDVRLLGRERQTQLRDRPAANPVERRMRGNAHVRRRADHRVQTRHDGSPPVDDPDGGDVGSQRQALVLWGDVPTLDRRRDARGRDPLPQGPGLPRPRHPRSQDRSPTYSAAVKLLRTRSGRTMQHSLCNHHTGPPPL
jgi:hypothetical protein